MSRVSISLDEYHEIRQRAFCEIAGIEYVPPRRPSVGVGDIALLALLAFPFLLAFL